MIKFERLDIEKILRHYNVRNITHRGEEVQFSCPFPEHTRGDRNPSSSINTENGKYHCFSCGRSGTVVNFIAAIEEVPLAVAKRWLEESYGGTINKDTSLKKLVQGLMQQKEVKHEEEIIIDDSHIRDFSVDWEKAYNAYIEGRLPKELGFVFRRGFKSTTLSHFQIGWDSRSNRITIPIRNYRGQLVGFKGRSYNESPRYKAIGDKKGSGYGFPTCKVHKYIWGIDSADSDVIIVEGEFDAIWLRQNGWKGAISIGGSNPSPDQIALIKRVGTSALLLLDPDEAGRKAERKLIESLIGYMPVRIAELSNGDPAETDYEELTQIMSQAQNALTQKIKHKIHS